MNISYRRSHRTPPKGQRCDASTGVDFVTHDPTIVRCENEATVELVGGPFSFETWVCERCAQALLEKFPTMEQ